MIRSFHRGIIWPWELRDCRITSIQILPWDAERFIYYVKCVKSYFTGKWSNLNLGNFEVFEALVAKYQCIFQLQILHRLLQLMFGKSKEKINLVINCRSYFHHSWQLSHYSVIVWSRRSLVQFWKATDKLFMLQLIVLRSIIFIVAIMVTVTED